MNQYYLVFLDQMRQIDIDGKKIFAPLKDKWLVLTPEERVRQEYICRLVNHYGFDLAQMDQEVQ
ncbi:MULTISPECIES: type I restriction enzyme HsdR N-terminal domain-containing protein [Acinetobacter]|nr:MULTISPECIES: type I restriction enzyme HsdR N-terminal domain-containing protein [Acinetobacter]